MFRIFLFFLCPNVQRHIFSLSLFIDSFFYFFFIFKWMFFFSVAFQFFINSQHTIFWLIFRCFSFERFDRFFFSIADDDFDCVFFLFIYIIYFFFGWKFVRAQVCLSYTYSIFPIFIYNFDSSFFSSCRFSNGWLTTLLCVYAYGYVNVFSPFLCLCYLARYFLLKYEY